MANVVAPPKMIVKDRKIEFEDIATYVLKPGDKWFHKSAGKAYFVIKKPKSDRIAVAVVDLD